MSWSATITSSGLADDDTGDLIVGFDVRNPSGTTVAAHQVRVPWNAPPAEVTARVREVLAQVKAELGPPGAVTVGSSIVEL